MVMKDKKTPWILKFFLRAVLGAGIILFVNQVLTDKNIGVAVAINMFSIIVSGMLGVPGICAMYGLLFYQFM